MKRSHYCFRHFSTASLRIVISTVRKPARIKASRAFNATNTSEKPTKLLHWWQILLAEYKLEGEHYVINNVNGCFSIHVDSERRRYNQNVKSLEINRLFCIIIKNLNFHTVLSDLGAWNGEIKINRPRLRVAMITWTGILDMRLRLTRLIQHIHNLHFLLVHIIKSTFIRYNRERNQ